MFKTLVYIIYKIINNLLFYVLVKLNVVQSNIPITRHTQIYLNLNHKTTHLGDRLFLWDLLHVLNADGIEIIVDHDDQLTKIFISSTGVKFRILEVMTDETLCLSLKPMFLANLVRDPSTALRTQYLDYQKFDGPLSIKLATRLCQNSKHLDQLPFLPKKSEVMADLKKVILFNNYVDSGKFRLAFIDKSLLDKECIKLKRDGYEIWHVGSQKDKQYDKVDYSFVDLDLRGTTGLSDIIQFFRDGQVQEVVSFDNIFLHLAELYQIKSNILFRGKFTKKVKSNHFNSINVGLMRTRSRVNYVRGDDA